MQTDATLLANNVVTLLRPFAWNHNNVGTYCVQFETGQLLARQVQTFLLFCDRRSVVQQCCARLHGTSTMLTS